MGGRVEVAALALLGVCVGVHRLLDVASRLCVNDVYGRAARASLVSLIVIEERLASGYKHLRSILGGGSRQWQGIVCQRKSGGCAAVYVENQYGRDILR